MDSQIDISVITVNFNGFSDTCEFIDSWVATILSVSFEIIVIDNGSTKDESSLLKQRYPFLNVIRSEKNLGFAGANNIGIKVAKGKYLFFLNNDVVLTHDTVHLLVNRLSSLKQIAGVSPLIRDYHVPHAIQFAGYTPLSFIKLRNQAIGEGKLDGEYPASPTPYLHGAAMLMKANAVRLIGSMPEEYFLYYEELDWCTHITDLGFQLWYEPACEIYHKGSTTTGKNSPLKAYYLSRNRLLFTYRNRTGITRYTAIFYQLVIVLPKDMLKALIRGQIYVAIAHLKGIIAFIKL